MLMKSRNQDLIGNGSAPLLLLALSLYGMALVSSATAAEESEAEAKTAEISFYRDIRPIFQAECHGCHQPAKDKGGYVMTDFTRLVGIGDSEKAAIVPGKPDESFLVEQITPVDGEAEMPQKGDPLSAASIDMVRRWIEAGAVDDTPAHLNRVYNLENPPEYVRSPVISARDYSPDGSLIAVGGFHEVVLHRADGSGLVGRLMGLSA
jgi:mono/diheme cytochrome c family protein